MFALVCSVKDQPSTVWVHNLGELKKNYRLFEILVAELREGGGAAVSDKRLREWRRERQGCSHERHRAKRR